MDWAAESRVEQVLAISVVLSQHRIAPSFEVCRCRYMQFLLAALLLGLDLRKQAHDGAVREQRPPLPDVGVGVRAYDATHAYEQALTCRLCAGSPCLAPRPSLLFVLYAKSWFCRSPATSPGLHRTPRALQRSCCREKAC
jgi:hypothetical protein